jgi:chitin deacetylase
MPILIIDFASNYPPGWQTPPASSLPKAWTDKLASIQMPDIQPSQPNNGYPTYTGNEKGGDDHICSFTYECTTKDDLVAPPDGILAVSTWFYPTTRLIM